MSQDSAFATQGCSRIPGRRCGKEGQSAEEAARRWTSAWDGTARRGGVYYVGFAVGEVAESAEGSRLLSGYRAKSSVQGSNPCLSAMRP
jgi:hypothetical protein